MSKRVFYAGLYHETHCFLPGLTRIDDFSRREGDCILAMRGDGSPMDGALEVAMSRGWDIVPAADYRAMPSATVDHEVFERFWARLASTWTEAGPVDAIFLVLHGAMVTDRLDDVEGELLSRVRGLPGAALLPLFGVFDLHASFTRRMAVHADCLIGYRENPHTDAREAAMRAAQLLQRSLDSGKRPRMDMAAPGIVWPPSGTGTAMRPMAELCRLARAAEAAEPSLWGVSVVGGFAYNDSAEAGVSIVACGEDRAVNARVANEIASAAWAMRWEGLSQGKTPAQALASMPPTGGKPVILVDYADNIGGGAAGDDTAVLRAMVEAGTERGLVVIADPGAVAALDGIEIGGSARLSIGGWSGTRGVQPIELDVVLEHRSDGVFELEDRQSHLASMSGTTIDMGPCATVRHGGVTILLTSRKMPPFDLGQLRSQGIEPLEFAVIGVKAAVAHKRAYDPITGASIEVEGDGPCTNRLERLPYRRLERPIFPLDMGAVLRAG